MKRKTVRLKLGTLQLYSPAVFYSYVAFLFRRKMFLFISPFSFVLFRRGKPIRIALATSRRKRRRPRTVYFSMNIKRIHRRKRISACCVIRAERGSKRNYYVKQFFGSSDYNSLFVHFSDSCCSEQSRF